MSKPERLARELAAAMSDGTPIGWDALIARAEGNGDQRWFRRLRHLDAVRSQSDSGRRATDAVTDAVIQTIVFVAWAQVSVSFALAAIDAVRGTPIGWPLPQVALAIAYAGGALFLLRARNDPRTLPLLATFLIAAAAFCRARRESLVWSGPIDVVLFGVFPDAFLPASLWAFALHFPGTPRFTSFDRIARMCVRGAVLIASVLFIANVALAYTNAPVLQIFRREQGSPLYWLTFTVVLFAAVASLFARALRATADERQRVKHFAKAMFSGMLPFVVWEVALYTVPGASAWARVNPPPVGRLFIDAVVITGFLSMPFSMARAVTSDRALTVTGFLRRATQHALARATLTAGTVLPLVSVASLLYSNRNETLTAVMGTRAGILLSSLTVISGLALATRTRLLGLVDRAFSKPIVDHRQELAASLSLIRGARSRREAASVLAGGVQRTIGAESLAVLASDHDRFTAEIGQLADLPADSAIVAVAKGESGLLDLGVGSALNALLPRTDRAWLDRHGIAVVVPIKHRNDELQALLAFGHKQDGLPLSPDERWLIDSLTTATAAVWDSFARRPTGSASARDPDEESAIECSRCGMVTTDPPLLCACDAPTRVSSLPAVLNGKFRIAKRIGSGAMGVVYLGEDVDLGRPVALKTLPVANGQAITRLRQEARSMALVTHESLALIYGLEVWRDTPVLVMEYLRRGTLADRLRRERMPINEALAMGMRLAEGLTAIHDAGLLHRDIKPTNIGVAENGVPKLLDFGVAGLIESVGELAGTPLYWPPEVFHGGSPSDATDVWALTIVIFEAIAGVYPFKLPATSAIRARSRRSDADWTITGIPGAPMSLNEFFRRALSSDRRERPQSARQIHKRLEVLLESTKAFT